MMRCLRAVLKGFVVAMVLGACMTRPPAPVIEGTPLRAVRPLPPPVVEPPAPAGREPDWRPQTYMVKRGDTLQQIALDHGLDYRDIAAWNNIENINVIRVGQALLLSPPGEPGAAASPRGESGATAPGAVTTAPLSTGSPEPRPPAPMPPVLPPSAARGNSAGFKSEPRAVKVPYSEQALAQVQHTVAPAAAEARANAAPQ